MARLPIGKHGRLHRGGPTAGHDPIPHAVELTSGDSTVTVTWSNDHTADLSAPGSPIPTLTYSSYTPSLTAATTNPTNWTATGYYAQDGDMVHCVGKVIAATSATAGTGEWYISLPVTTSFNGEVALGTARMQTLVSSQYHIYPLWPSFQTSSTMVFKYPSTWPGGLLTTWNAAGGYTPTASFDFLVWNVLYRAP